MSSRIAISCPEDILKFARTELGPTSQLLVDQSRINAFADCTADRQWIHIDPERAAVGPYFQTVAHGYLTLSLLSAALYELVSLGPGVAAVNYGLDRVRFPAPVPSGSVLQMWAQVANCKQLNLGVQVKYSCRFEIADVAKPACIADALIRYLPVRQPVPDLSLS
jgi:acyl dehydratase